MQVVDLVDGACARARVPNKVSKSMPSSATRRRSRLRLLALLGREALEVVIEVAVAAGCASGTARRGATASRRSPKRARSSSATNSPWIEENSARLREFADGGDQQSRACVAASRSGRTSSRGAGGRRERHAEHELRVVGEAVLRIGLRPGEVEDEFAERMRLDVGGRGGGEPAFVVQRDRRRLPAGAGADAAGVLERREKRVTQEGRAAARRARPRRPDQCP